MYLSFHVFFFVSCGLRSTGGTPQTINKKEWSNICISFLYRICPNLGVVFVFSCVCICLLWSTDGAPQTINKEEWPNIYIYFFLNCICIHNLFVSIMVFVFVLLFIFSCFLVVEDGYEDDQAMTKMLLLLIKPSIHLGRDENMLYWANCLVWSWLVWSGLRYCLVWSSLVWSGLHGY